MYYLFCSFFIILILILLLLLFCCCLCYSTVFVGVYHPYYNTATILCVIFSFFLCWYYCCCFCFHYGWKTEITTKNFSDDQRLPCDCAFTLILAGPLILAFVNWTCVGGNSESSPVCLVSTSPIQTVPLPCFFFASDIVHFAPAVERV